MLESRPTRGLVAKPPQCSSLAVCEFRVTSEECCTCDGWVCVKLLLDVVMSEVHQNDCAFV